MTRKHVFVNFTDRVAAIRIDPIRRSEQKRNAPDASNTESLFMSGLERWNELNLATGFTSFSGRCGPMAQSLPMILYNKSKIFDLLVESLDTADEHSVEPLLDLLVQFARDLGEDFEAYYSRALQVCINLIEKNQREDKSLATVELTFNCLAHLFKYLSRLLTTNLVPTYDLLVPLFGGDKDSKQRSFVLRFAAESMAFLVRRAKGESLTLIVDHIVERVASDPANMQYMSSSSQLLASTLKGPQTSLHSKAPQLLAEYFESCHKHREVNLLGHIIIEVLHHTRQETAGPIYETILACAEKHKDEFSARCIFIIAGLRKGSRVSDWDSMYQALLGLASSASSSISWSEAAGAVLSFSDVLTCTKYIKEVLDAIPDLKILYGVMKIVKEANENILSSNLALFWLAALSKTRATSEDDLKSLSLICLDIGFPEASNSVVKALGKLEGHKLLAEHKEPEASSFLFSIWWSAVISKHSATRGAKKTLDTVLKLLANEEDPALRAFGSVVIAEVMQMSPTEECIKNLPQILEQPLHPKLLDAIRSLLASSNVELDAQSIIQQISPKLFANLSSCDRRVRGAAIELLKQLLSSSAQDYDPNFLLDQCSLINDLPHDLENARNISHRLRTLATKYKLSGTNSKEAQVVSDTTLYFFFGMLTTRLQPVWTAVLELVPKLCEKDAAKVCALSMQFIEHPSPILSMDLVFGGDEMMDAEDEQPYGYQNLDCNTLDMLQNVGETSWSNSSALSATLESRAIETLQFEHYDDVRTLGIKALCTIPSIAEKQIVPSLVTYLVQVEDDENEEELNQQTNDASVAFTFKDKLALLELFAHLKRPEQLPRFDEVRDRYLYFLSSRHAPLQRLGLNCLLAVHDPDCKVMRKYKANFDALLDDKRFRDELMIFICGDKDQADEGSIHPDDRAILMPYVVRILYGRAQNSTKRNMRYAVLSSLHFLEPQHLIMFVELAQSQLIDSKAIESGSDFSDRSSSRKVHGYLTLMSDLVNHLKTAARDCTKLIVTQGLFPILDNLNLSEDKSLRQLVTKNLDELFNYVPDGKLWSTLYPTVYEKLIEPQLPDFTTKNQETPSTLMRMLLSISNSSDLINLLDEKVLLAVVSCLSHSAVKDSVIILVLKLVINFVSFLPASPVTSIAITDTVKYLPLHMEKELSVDCFAIVVDAINKIFSLGVNKFNKDVIHNIALVSFGALQRPSRLVPLHIKGSLLLALSQILDHPQCADDLIIMAYHKLAPLFRQFVSAEHRLNLTACYEVFGKRHTEFARAGRLITELNSFDAQRLGEPDFARRSLAFEEINEKLWAELTEIEWEPLMFNMLFFVRDPEELALRNNGKYALMRLIESQHAPTLVSEYVLPAIKRGLRDSDDKFRRLYIDLLSQCAHFDVMPSLKVLLYRGDEEADFFINVNHVQVHRRRRAIQRLGRHAAELDSNVIAHYLLSIVENFAMLSGSKNADNNNLADDALHAITELVKHISVGQFKSVARRCVQNVLQGPEPAKLRKNVRIVTAVAQATPSGIDDFVLNVIIAPLQRFLSANSNEHENLPDRIPLSVAITYFMKSLDKQVLEAQLPGKMTPLCHLLRSKIPEMRDTVRQSLGRICRILGATYLHFLISELYGALRRGGLQSHVLGFTVHSLLVELTRQDQIHNLSVGAMDDSASMIFRVVMNDTFGSIGEEKDAEGYVTAAKEVKQHKSYNTAEILATWTSLSQFGRIVEPMREFLSSTKLSSKAEHKVEEVLRRLAAGMHKNPQANTQDAVVMGYEIFSLCDRVIANRAEATMEETARKQISESLAAREQADKESEEFFTVRLSSRDWYEGDSFGKGNRHKGVDWARSTRFAPTNLHLLQTFSLETLRSVLTNTSGGATTNEGKGLLNVANVKGLSPIIVKGLESTHEDLNIAALRLATTAFRLPVPYTEEDKTLEICGQRTLHFIESSTNTNSSICQSSLKLLTMMIRTKPEFEISSGAVAYILERLRPDLEEPERQGTAISFARAIFARKLMIPQVYDIADTIANVLVTNQSEHIRANCRAAYLHFLTSYPLGQTRLDRHLVALGANLRYAAPAGRLSVMEMIHSLLQKIHSDQLESAFINYFASLALLLVTDSEPECRKRALSLMEELINTNTSPSIADQMVEYCSQWLSSLGKNDLLLRGGLEVAPLLEKKLGSSTKITKLLHSTVGDILRAGQRSSKDAVEWQLVYLALQNDVSDMMDLVEGVILYPHPWVRARAARAFGHYFKVTPKDEIPLSLLVRVGHKLVRQLGAPKLSTADSLQIVKDLVYIIPIWGAKEARMDAVVAAKDEETSKPGRLCIEWLFHKLGSMIRTDASATDLIGGKTGAVQLLASMPSLLNKEALEKYAYDAIMSLYVLTDQLTSEDVHEELRDLAQEAMSMYDNALGTTEYLKRYTEAQRFVHDRRRERRAKRSIEAVTDPEAFAQRKMRRNVHKHDARKRVKKHKSY